MSVCLYRAAAKELAHSVANQNCQGFTDGKHGDRPGKDAGV